MEESQGDKLARKAKESPFMPIGLAGLAAALGYGAYKWKHKGEMSPSFFLVQLRVGAQGMVVGALCVGILATMGKRLQHHFSDKEQ